MKYKICFERYDGSARCGQAIFTKQEAQDIAADMNRRHPTIKHWSEPETAELVADPPVTGGNEGGCC